ncbi:MAG: hypothetical protein OEP48_00540 [Betaproteobacteria bacterium]|nr:hypothetical protein [Betaproteobacteria bacterium]MDH3435436.1 hypothetical protein [Betaproteobacteria bacterium]
MTAKIALPFVLVAMLVGPPPAPALGQEGRLEPVDEAARDPSWVSFRNRLLNAAEVRDRKHVMGILAQDVRTGLEAPRGAAEFRKRWEVDAEKGPLWHALRSALFLGSAYLERENGRRELCAPYLLAKWPQDVDPFQHGAAVAREVLVKAGPSSRSATVQVLSYDIVTISDWEVTDKAADVKQRWVKVKVRNGEGYVPEEQIRSPIEHAACFVKTEGGWRMTGLAPGGG